jgi:hypothetical protein
MARVNGGGVCGYGTKLARVRGAERQRVGKTKREGCACVTTWVLFAAWAKDHFGFVSVSSDISST